MIKTILISIITISLSCGDSNKDATKFDEKALANSAVDLNGNSTSVANILEEHKGKVLFLDFWAAWCKDCIKGMPKVKTLKEQHPEVEFVFLSVDTESEKWKNRISKLNIDGIGNHYILDGDMKSAAIAQFIDLNWIPRYMVLDKTGEIRLFKSIDASEKAVKDLFTELGV